MVRDWLCLLTEFRLSVASRCHSSAVTNTKARGSHNERLKTTGAAEAGGQAAKVGSAGSAWALVLGGTPGLPGMVGCALAVGGPAPGGGTRLEPRGVAQPVVRSLQELNLADIKHAGDGGGLGGDISWGAGYGGDVGRVDRQ
jgi:hypothetical protein